ncbi:MAG: dihydroorotate dehydrogenase electron transfer subunit [Armatimonadetes bacterium]|nr:dihydroorotate dehydrogenase electron transfer subunit [Armatimonadota bacterium]
MGYFPAVEILQQEKLTADCFRISLICPQIAGSARPGQFLHVKINPGLEPLLRRPFSVHAVNRETGEIALLYRVVGRGTRLLAQKRKGDSLDLIGPLGRGFDLPAAGQRVALVAGGIGIAPLYFLLQTLAGAGNSPDVLLGARTAQELLLVRKVQELVNGGVLKEQLSIKKGRPGSHNGSLSTFPGRVMVATDDGSCGHRGPVTDLLAGLLAEEKVEMVYACGPAAMLKVVASLLERYGVDGEVSLEERMGCGIGACLSCVCKTRGGNRQDFSYRRVCLEGPVFKARDVVWGD